MDDSRSSGIFADLDSLGFRDGPLPRTEGATNKVEADAGVAPPLISSAALEAEQVFFPTEIADWEFQDTRPYEIYHGANPFDAALRSASWELPLHFTRGNSSGHVQLSHNAEATGSGQTDGALRGSSTYRNPTLDRRTLTAAQQETAKLPSCRSPNSAGSPECKGSDHKRANSSPEPTDASKAGSRKRKPSIDMEEDDEDDDVDESHPVKRSAHNMVEKRYRTNLNDKIAALRDSVPALRIMSKSARGEDTTEDREELQGLTPAHKLNKATVLSKATEYIRHLEKRNSRLSEENASMMARINAFEKLFIAVARSGQMPNPLQQQSPTPLEYSQNSPAFLDTPLGTPQGSDPAGMGPVRDDMKRILSSQQMVAGRPYLIHPHFAPNPGLLRQQQVQQQQQETQAQAGRWSSSLGKLMVGSMAGLMLVEALVETEQSSESREGRGLSAAPLQLLSDLVHSTYLSVGGHYVSAISLIARLRLVCLVALFMWELLSKTPWGRAEARSEKPRHASVPKAVPSLASPIHVRRQAWLTAIQTVWVPPHNFVLEATALLLKTLKYMLRNIFGDRAYLVLTGLSEEQETARVKAWTTALDAQLAGGDGEINRSRLVLTLIASGTLPVTPLRLMMKALHIRVLLWEFNGASYLANLCGAKLVRARWLEARRLNRLLTSLRGADGGPDEDLADHLALLLEQDCDEVLDDCITQRAHNLAWNDGTRHKAPDKIMSMDLVIEDAAVRSPMDAVAAWHSSAILQRVLANRLAHICTDGDGTSVERSTSDDITLAVNIAPIGSYAQIRALVARATLVPEERGASIAAAIQALGLCLDQDEHSAAHGRGVPYLIESPTTTNLSAPDVRIALRCAMAIAHLQRFASPPKTLAIIDPILPSPAMQGMSLLACTASFLLMDQLDKHAVARETCSTELETLAGSLRIWVGSSDGEQECLADGLRKTIIDRCLRISKSMVGIQVDPGYGSMEDECESGSLY